MNIYLTLSSFFLLSIFSKNLDFFNPPGPLPLVCICIVLCLEILSNILTCIYVYVYFFLSILDLANFHIQPDYTQKYICFTKQLNLTIQPGISMFLSFKWNGSFRSIRSIRSMSLYTQLWTTESTCNCTLTYVLQIVHVTVH